MTPPGLGEYCRALETHLCQVNQGHLVRIVGPAFDMVKRWHAEGIPTKIAFRGIDRRAARAARSAAVSASPRRPLRIEFCEADVLDVLDEWRRAIGFALNTLGGPQGESAGQAGESDRAEPSPDADAASGRTPSLPKHLDRVAVRLTSFLASESAAGSALRAAVVATLDAVERLRGTARARGDARRAVLEELDALDGALMAAVLRDAPDGWLDDARHDARAELIGYESRVPVAEFDRLVDRAAQRLLRSRLQLPDLKV
jgi:hypothetical protein